MILNMAELTWVELDALDRETTALLFPISPLEQHGPHLPIGLDLFGAEFLARKVAEGFESAHPDWNTLLVPALPIGSNAFDMPGGMFSSQRLLRDTLVHYLSCQARHGFKKMLLLSVHGGTGHLVALEEACSVVNRKFEARTVAPTGALAMKYFTGAYDEELSATLGRNFSEDEIRFLRCDWHAGWWETSLMLLISEAMVKDDFRDMKPVLVDDFKKIGDELIRKVGGGQGVLGAPHLASKDFAQALIDLLVRDTVTIMERILVSGQKVSADERSPLFNIPFLRTDFLRQSAAVGAGVLLTLIGGIPIIEAVRQGLRSAPGDDPTPVLNQLEPSEPTETDSE